MAALLGGPAADPVDPGAVALAEHAVDQAVVAGQVVLGQEADLEGGLGDAGQARLVGRPRLLVEVAAEPVRDEVVGEPFLGDRGVAVVQAAGLGLELDEERALVVIRSSVEGVVPIRSRRAWDMCAACTGAVVAERGPRPHAVGRDSLDSRGMMPDRRSPTRYVTPLREGGSLPGLVEADDDGLYVVKFRGAGQGPRALVAEWLAGELARAIGLPVPELVADRGGRGPGRRRTRRGDPRPGPARAAGLNLGHGLPARRADLQPGGATAPASIDAEFAADVVWLDALRDEPRPHRRRTRTCSSGTAGRG